MKSVAKPIAKAGAKPVAVKPTAVPKKPLAPAAKGVTKKAIPKKVIVAPVFVETAPAIKYPKLEPFASRNLEQWMYNSDPEKLCEHAFVTCLGKINSMFIDKGSEYEI